MFISLCKFINWLNYIKQPRPLSEKTSHSGYKNHRTFFVDKWKRSFSLSVFIGGDRKILSNSSITSRWLTIFRPTSNINCTVLVNTKEMTELILISLMLRKYITTASLIWLWSWIHDSQSIKWEEWVNSNCLNSNFPDNLKDSYNSNYSLCTAL